MFGTIWALTDRALTTANLQAAMGARDYDMTFVSYCAGDDPVIGVRRKYHSTQITPNPFTNTSGFREPKVTVGDGTMDDLWDRAVPNPSLYGAIQTKAVQQVPMVWTTETINSRVSRAICGGINNQNTGLFLETAFCG